MASRKEEKERRKRERLAAEQAAHQESRRRRTYGIVVGGVLVLAVIGAVIAIAASGGGSGGSNSGAGPSSSFEGAVNPPAQTNQDLFAAAKQAGCELKNPPIAGRNHIPSSKAVTYSTNPPTSGDHDQLPQPDGVYTKQPEPRHVLHALEGGRVELQYKPGIPAKRLKQLGGFYNDNNQYLLLYPNDTMKYEVAISSWGHLAGCKKITDATFDVIRDFYDRYADKAPEPAATHQPSVNQPGWPGQIPPFHSPGAIPGS